MFGRFPEHLWIAYFVQALYLIPRKFYNMWRAKPLNQALYYLDFCWMTNFTAMLFMAYLLLSALLGLDVDQEMRKTAFKAMIGVGCGTLLSANIALPFVAMIFHDVNTMTGLFIHIMPPVVLYTFMWHTGVSTRLDLAAPIFCPTLNNSNVLSHHEGNRRGLAEYIPF